MVYIIIIAPKGKPGPRKIRKKKHTNKKWQKMDSDLKFITVVYDSMCV